MTTLPTPAGRASAPKQTRRRGPGTALRARYRNEVKTRLSDDEYDALLRYQALHGIESLSAALGRCARISLFGVIGMLPTAISGLSEEVAQNGPRS